MNLNALKKPLWLELARSLGLNLQAQTRKPAIIEAIEALEADDEEVLEYLELIAEGEKAKREAEGKAKREAEEQAKLEAEQRKLEAEE